jgi:hypothetical protein
MRRLNKSYTEAFVGHVSIELVSKQAHRRLEKETMWTAAEWAPEPQSAK